MYLNANVYIIIVISKEYYDSAIMYSTKVINAGYSLETNSSWLFLNDNYKCTNEFILTINYDGTKTQNYGCKNYIVWAGSNSDEGDSLLGIKDGASKHLPKIFPIFTGTIDQRSLFLQKVAA